MLTVGISVSANKNEAFGFIRYYCACYNLVEALIADSEYENCNNFSLLIYYCIFSLANCLYYLSLWLGQIIP